VRGVSVTFMVTDGGGSFNGESQVTVQTDASGSASRSWTLGPSSGSNAAIVTAPVPNVSLGFTAMATAAPTVETMGVTTTTVATTLTANVNPNGLTTSAWFEWGTS